jgi:hypothetical protein
MSGLAKLSPMDAVSALYSGQDWALSEAIISSLSRAVFSGAAIKPAGLVQRAMARASYRHLKRTTTRRDPPETSGFSNRLLERSGHPYAHSLLSASRKEIEALVEGGDPMNGPYMMLAPEIRGAGSGWDRIFFNSVQGRDVQLRFVWETRATYEEARLRLEQGASVRLKALAAGTGLSMILAWDRLVRDGYDPSRITARITDRELSNTEKTKHLLSKLATTRTGPVGTGAEAGISAVTEDIFVGEAPAGGTPVAAYDVVTSVGILEYLQGFTCDTTEQRHGHPVIEEPATAHHLAASLDKITKESGSLIVNTYRPHASTRILEVFGKKFDYRHRENLASLLATAGLRSARLIGSGNIYDVEIYEKHSRQSTDSAKAKESHPV